MKKIVNCETGEETLVELSAEDLAQQEIDEALSAQIKAEADAKRQARLTILEKLGLTEDEANLLLS